MKKLDVYEEVLEAIADGTDLSAGEMSRRAMNALNLFKTDRDAEHKALLVKIRDYMIRNGLIFATGPELAEALNAAQLTTTRGKVWTKASIARYLSEVRAMVQSELAPKNAEEHQPKYSAPVQHAAEQAEQDPQYAEPNPADEPATAAPIQVTEPIVVTAQQTQIANSDELDELEALLNSELV